MAGKIEIKSEERIFNQYFKIDEAVLNDGTGDYKESKLTRPNAVAVLVYNEETENVILVNQFRYPVGKNIVEAVAGKIDGEESSKTAAVREILEEIGYKITEDMLSNPIEMYPSPGYSSEVIYIFLVIVKSSDKVEAGGGVVGEHENINIVEMHVTDFISKIKSNEIKDSKTIIASSLIRL